MIRTKKKMVRRKPIKMTRTKQHSINKRMLRKLRKEAVKYMPHIKSVLYDLSINSLLYHLPENRVEYFKKNIYET